MFTSEPTLLLPALAFFAAAALCAPVGHGGASAYLALMALTGFAPSDIKSAALKTSPVCGQTAGGHSLPAL